MKILKLCALLAALLLLGSANIGCDKTIHEADSPLHAAQ